MYEDKSNADCSPVNNTYLDYKDHRSAGKLTNEWLFDLAANKENSNPKQIGSKTFRSS